MTNITITSITKKSSTSGKTYWQVESSEGKMSVWDKDLAKDIEDKLLGKVVDAEYSTDGKYKNLKAVLGVVTADKITTTGEAIGQSAKMKRRSEMMQVAKDLVLEAFKDDNKGIDLESDKRLATLIQKVKIVWADLLRTIGDEVPNDNCPEDLEEDPEI